MQNKTLVLIPALMCTSAIYTNQLRYFNKKNYHLLSFYNYSLNNISDMATDIADKISALTKGHKFFLAGTSMGGYVAMQIALLYPKQIAGLVLINTTIFADSESKKTARLNAIESALQQTDKQFNSNITQLDSILSLYLHNKNEFNYTSLKNMYLQIGRTGLINQQKAILNRANFSNIKDINIPTLIIGADKDKVIPTDETIKMYKSIPNSTLKIIKNSAHLSPLDQPAIVNKIIYNWIEKL